jgi:hypothetical protein
VFFRGIDRPVLLDLIAFLVGLWRQLRHVGRGGIYKELNMSRKKEGVTPEERAALLGEMSNDCLHDRYISNADLWRQPHIPFAYLQAAEKMFGVMLTVAYTQAFMRIVPRGIEVPVYGEGATFPDPVRLPPVDDDYMLVTHEEAEVFSA